MHLNPIGGLEKPRFLILITFEPYLSSLIGAHARGQIKEKWEVYTACRVCQQVRQYSKSVK